jgi:hypothetical protein
MIVKCFCNNCPGQIEFDPSELVEENSIVPCPHCGLDTKLFIPQAIGGSRPIAHIETDKMIIRKHGTKDELELDVDKVIIRKRGFANALASGMNGDRTILISSITAIQMLPGGMIRAGYILFSYAGSKPFTGGLFKAASDPDTFLFMKELNEQVANFKAKVEKIISNSKKTASSNNNSGTLTDELRKLAERRVFESMTSSAG